MCCPHPKCNDHLENVMEFKIHSAIVHGSYLSPWQTDYKMVRPTHSSSEEVWPWGSISGVGGRSGRRGQWHLITEVQVAWRYSYSGLADFSLPIPLPREPEKTAFYLTKPWQKIDDFQWISILLALYNNSNNMRYIFFDDIMEKNWVARRSTDIGGCAWFYVFDPWNVPFFLDNEFLYVYAEGLPGLLEWRIRSSHKANAQSGPIK